MKMEGGEKEKKEKKGGGIINQGLSFCILPIRPPCTSWRCLPWPFRLWGDGKGETVNGLCGLLPAGRVR
jgi:hypothetical protein